MKVFEVLLQLHQQGDSNPQQRRRTAVLPKRNWIQRNPRLFTITFTTVSLLVFFSKPLYDGFIADPVPAPPGPASSRRGRL